MKEYTRNLAVGLTVIVALALLGGMILLFTGLPQMFQGGYPVLVASSATHNAHVGDIIFVAGLQVGRVTEISFVDPSQPTQGVHLRARIDDSVLLPANAKFFFSASGFVGNTYLEIQGDGEPVRDAAGRPLPHFPTDGSVAMESVFVGSSMIPKELTDSLKGLGELADNINTLISPAQPATGEAATGPASTQPAGLKGTIEKLNRALDGVAAVMGDEENQKNLKTSLANLAQATALASEAMQALKEFAGEATQAGIGVNELADELIEDADRIGELMSTINRTALKIEAGEGSAGKLINDPELYNNLVDASRQMTLLMKDFRQLVDQWKATGVQVKLK